MAHHLGLEDEGARAIVTVHLDLEELDAVGRGEVLVVEDRLELSAVVREPSARGHVVGVEEAEELLPLPAGDVVLRVAKSGQLSGSRATREGAHVYAVHAVDKTLNNV